MSEDLAKRVKDLEADVKHLGDYTEMLEEKIDRLKERLSGRIDELARSIREDAEANEAINRWRRLRGEER